MTKSPSGLIIGVGTGGREDCVLNCGHSSSDFPFRGPLFILLNLLQMILLNFVVFLYARDDSSSYFVLLAGRRFAIR